MLATATFALTALAALGCGIVGGVFFAFSTFIMRALGRLAPAQGIAAMQAINVTVLTPWFMVPFLGTGLAAAALALTALPRWREPDAALRLLGSTLYLVGGIGVTVACNVPRNDALARAIADSPAAAELWSRYLPEWTAWNTVRTVAALGAAAALVAAMLRPAR